MHYEGFQVNIDFCSQKQPFVRAQTEFSYKRVENVNKFILLFFFFLHKEHFARISQNINPT